MRFELAEKIFNHLYAPVDGYALSARSKERLGTTDKTLVYGEATLPAMRDILDTVPLSGRHQVFYDLGSGTGKAVLAAALLGNFSRVVGMELLDGLHTGACEVLNKFDTALRPRLLPEWPVASIDFIQGDILQTPIPEADVVFMQSTCFSDEMMATLEENLAEQKPGSLIISVTKSFSAPYLPIINAQKYRMGWGEVTVYTHHKIT